MALKKCKECGTEISSKADTCPHCGAPQKRKHTSLLAWLVLGGIIVAVYNGLTPGSHTTTPAAPAKPAPPSPLEQARKATTLTFTWAKGGFDNVLILNTLKLTNAGPHAIKDIALACTVYSPSQTALGTLRQTLYVRIPAGKSHTERDFNMGLIHTQAHTVACRIVDLALVD